MPHDVDITTGADNSALQTGLGQLRSYGEQVAASLRGTFAQTFAVTGIIAAFTQITRSTIAYASHVEDLSERFDVSTKTIQQWGNVAEQQGSSLEGLARGFNKLEISQAKAIKGDEELRDAFASVGVSLTDLRNLNAEDIALKIAHSNMNAADMVKIFGKNALELIPTFQAVADGSVPLGKAIDDNIIKKLDAADDTIKRFYQTSRVVFANILVGAQAVAAQLENFLTGGAYSEDQRRTEAAHPPTLSAARRPRSLGEEGVATGGGGGGGVSDRAESLRERLGKLQDEQYRASLSAEGKLRDITEERLGLETRLNELARIGGGEDGEEEQIKIDILGLDKQSADIQTKQAADQAKYLESVTREREAVERQVEAAVERNQVLEDTARFGPQIAQDLANQRQIEKEIKDAIDAANQARAAGNTALEKANQLLAAQLQQEKAITAAAAARRAEQKRLDDLAAGYQTFINNAAGYSFDELTLASKSMQDFLQKLTQARISVDQYATGKFGPVSPLERTLIDVLYRTAKQNQQNQIVGTADSLVQQAQQVPRTNAEEVAFLQGTAIPRVQSLIHPESQSYQLVQYLQQQLSTLQDILDTLTKTHGVIQGPPGGG